MNTHANHVAEALEVKETTALATLPDQALEHPNRPFTGINIGGDTVTQCTEHLPEDQKLLVRWLHHHLRSRGLNPKEAAALVGMDYSSIYRIFMDKYRNEAGERVKLDGFCLKIARVKKLAEARADVFSPGFIATSTWKKIEIVCHKALVRKKIALIYGRSQIGKTTCVKEFQRLNNGGQTTYMEMPPSAGVQLMTRCIAKALHVNTGKPFETLIQDVINALDSSKLLIIDEVHRVFTTYQKGSVMRCLDVLRYIYDQTGCGMVLSGTNVFRDELKQGEFFRYLEQLRRRAIPPLQLPATAPDEDLLLVLERFGLPWPSGNALMTFRHLASEDGFGMVISRLMDGAELAGKAKRKYAWSDFMEAHDIYRKMGLEAA